MAALEIFDRYEEIVGIIRGRGFFHELEEYLIVAGDDLLRAIGNNQDFGRQGDDFRRLFGRYQQIAADTANRLHRADCNRRLREGAGAGAGAAVPEDRDEILASAILQIERLLDQQRRVNFLPQRGYFRVQAPPNLTNAQNIAREMNDNEMAFLQANIGQIHHFENDLQRQAYNDILLERARQRNMALPEDSEEEEEEQEEVVYNTDGEEEEEKKEEEDDVEEL